METTQTKDLVQAEARLPRWMAGLSILGVLVLLAAGQGRLAAGFAVGAGLGVLNYLWLHQAIETLLATVQPRVPKSVAIRFAVRYPLAFGVVYLFYRTGWLPFTTVLAGLFVPVAAVLIEAGIQVGLGWRYDDAA